jgi:hypothetical protein
VVNQKQYMPREESEGVIEQMPPMPVEPRVELGSEIEESSQSNNE